MSSMSALKNEDFRKLLATPSASRSGGASAAATPALGQVSHSFTHKQTSNASANKLSKKRFKPQREKTKTEEDDIFGESQTKLNEILSKYRDRALERRKGLVEGDDADIKSKITAAYKVVPATATAAASVAERRKLEIQESKYLGGDMEHTHLVKGLDYSLLNKVRGEMNNLDDRDELETAYEAVKKEQEAEHISDTKLAKNICRIILQKELPKRNEMFAKGRMAYVVELEDEESDVPCTLLRSVVDCPANQSNENMNADNLLINKLAQVFGYLRTDAKKRKKAEGTTKDDNISKQKIYDEVDDYQPSRSRDQQKSNSNNDRKEKSSYFEGSSRHNDDNKRENCDRDRDREYNQRDRGYESRDQRDRNERQHYERDNRAKDRREERSHSKRNVIDNAPKSEQKPKRRRIDEEEDDAYAELYPSGITLLDAGGESDEEADFSKMDMGNRKGPIKRWDFDTEKEYESYQESREAMPKAAYQYGVKMNSGRKTRKNASMAGEKKIDRELDKINKILDDRKKSGYDKKPKY